MKLIHVFHRRLRDETGYSLVEVMASIIVLTLAILPMAGMFDMGLNSATSGSNYDKSRALANLKMEEAKSLPFAVVESNFPEAGNTTPFDSAWLTEADYPNFQYKVEKQYVTQPSTDPGFSESEEWIVPSDTPPTNLIWIKVTVKWTDGNEYSTFGLVSA